MQCLPLLQVGFIPEDISSIIKESIDAVLQNQQYNEQKVSQHLESIGDQVMQFVTASSNEMSCI